MLTPRNSEFARDQLLGHFADLPTLHFDAPRFAELAYGEPNLVRPPEFFNANRAFPHLHSGLAELFNCFKLGSQKLEYGRTSLEQWDAYLRFGADRLISDGKGKFKLAAVEHKHAEYVNQNRETAQRWFKEQLLPQLSLRPKTHAYVLGDPGAGKSTLIKYLICSNFDYLRSISTVMSRFEFLKFRYQWCHDLDFKSPDIGSALRRKLSEYISFITLRDALWALAYVEAVDGTRSRSTNFAHLQNDLTKLKNCVARALISLSPTDQETLRLARTIDGALCDHKIDFDRLGEIPHEFRVLISKYLLEDFHFVLVLDGLDCISLEDREFESERFMILDIIMRNRTGLTTFDLDLIVATNFGTISYPNSVTIPSASIFVMRENTFYLHEDGLKSEVRLGDPVMYRVESIDPEAAVFNVIARATDVWAASSRVDEGERFEVAQLLARATFLTLRFINRAIGTRKPAAEMLGLFCGNIRALFEFMGRLLQWVVEDAIRESLLMLGPGTTVRDIFVMMTGAAGLEVLRRKSYRVIEILLFSTVPWFENQVAINTTSKFAQRMLGVHSSPFQDNSQFTGVVDNIFNYHSTQRVRNNDQHRLVEKIRIVQLLGDDTMTPDDLAGALYRRVGYTSPHLDDTIAIMVRTQMISTRIRGRELYFTSTDRGKIIMKYLARTLSYIEHVFHRTLFPRVLIEKINDERRMKDVDRWTAASIRNAFIFLSYIKFVENNKAAGKTVPETLRILPGTRAGVIESIRRILYPRDDITRRAGHSERANPQRDAETDRRNQVVRDALRFIENTIGEWERAGCATAAKPR